MGESYCIGDARDSDWGSVLWRVEKKSSKKLRSSVVFGNTAGICTYGLMKGNDGKGWAAQCHFLTLGPPWQRTSCNWSRKNRGIEPRNAHQDLKIILFFFFFHLRAGLQAILFIVLEFNNSWVVLKIHFRRNIAPVCDSC